MIRNHPRQVTSSPWRLHRPSSGMAGELFDRYCRIVRPGAAVDRGRTDSVMLFGKEARRFAAVALVALCGGCAAAGLAEVQDTEQMLAAAGFAAQPADTPTKQAQLAALAPHKLLTQQFQPPNGGVTVGYVYGDPDQCRCVYVGDQKAYQTFQQMAFQKRIADEQMRAAEMQQDAAFDWGMWGPGFWGPGPVVIVHEHRRR
jgi:hypothetical protein